MQGVGAAIAAPGTLALIATSFEPGAPRNRALSIYSAVVGAGASIGLLLGGTLTAWASWRWGLFVNVPVGLAIVLLAPQYIAEPDRRPGRFDLAGALTSTAGMTCLVYGFIRASSHGWHDTGTRLAMVTAAVLLAVFVAIEIRARQPVMPLRLFADRNRCGAYLNMLLLSATMFGMFFFLTQFLQNVLGFGPLRTGAAFLPMTVTMFACVRTVPRLLPRFGAKPLIVTGAVLLTAGMVWLTQLSATSGYRTGVAGPMLLFGLGAGLSFMPLNTIILAGVPAADTGAASGLLQTTQWVGGSLGMSVLVAVFGTARRAASGTAQSIMADGIAGAFTTGAVFMAGALLVTLLAITARRQGQQTEGGRPAIPGAAARTLPTSPPRPARDPPSAPAGSRSGGA